LALKKNYFSVEVVVAVIAAESVAVVANECLRN